MPLIARNKCLPVQGAVFFTIVYPECLCGAFQGFHLHFQPFSLCPVLLFLCAPLWPTPGGPMLRSLIPSVFKREGDIAKWTLKANRLLMWNKREKISVKMVTYLAQQGSGTAFTGLVPRALSWCSILIVWFSCWGWLRASHWLEERGCPEVAPWFTRQRDCVVPIVGGVRFSPANLALDAKCEGGTSAETTNIISESEKHKISRKI